MNDLIIQAAGTIEAKGLFDSIDTLAGDAKQTAIAVFGAAFIVGALIGWAMKGFSVKAGIVALIAAAVGLAILSQLDAVKGMFGETISDTQAATVTRQVDVVADPLAGSVVVSGLA